MVASVQSHRPNISKTVQGAHSHTSMPSMSSLTSTEPVAARTSQHIEGYGPEKGLDERPHRLSLIPQRTASIPKIESSRRRGVDPVNTAARNIPATRGAGELQRSQSTRKISDFGMQSSGTHKRQASVDQVFLKHTISGVVLPQIPTRGHGRAREDSHLLPHDAVQQPKSNITQLPSLGGHRLDNNDTRGTNTPGQDRRLEYQMHGSGMHGKRTSVSFKTPRVLHSTHQGRGVSKLGRLRSVESISVVVDEKPAFSTMQQNFTLKQVKKYSAAPSSGESQDEQRASERVSPETTELRLELLQLHMLNRDSSAVQQQWQSSAEDHYRAHFESLASMHHSLISRERDAQVQVNAAALLAWGGSIVGSPKLDRKLRMLSNILTDAWDLCEPHGQYTCIVEAFEHWYTQASRILEAQNQPSTASSSSMSHMEQIGDGWKVEVALLTSKLHEHKQELSDLGASVESQSDLARSLVSLSAMLGNMLDELELLQQVEGAMVLQGSTWTRKTLASIAASVTCGMGGPT